MQGKQHAGLPLEISMRLQDGSECHNMVFSAEEVYGAYSCADTAALSAFLAGKPRPSRAGAEVKFVQGLVQKVTQTPCVSPCPVHITFYGTS